MTQRDRKVISVSTAKVSPVWLVLAGIVSVQFGAAIAKSLFDEINPTGMVWLRLATSAVIFMAVARPALRGRSKGDWLVAAGLAASLGGMNWMIYQSFARIPLGLAVTLEFIGPLTLALVMSRRARDLIWVALAGIGVALLGFERADLNLLGVLLALGAGAAWAGYIVFTAKTGQRWPGIEGLAVASVLAAVVMTPAAISTGGADLLRPHVIALGVAVGLLSSVIPYSLEMIALRSLPASAFSILMSLEPAAAALAGVLLLHELLSPLQLMAVACVIAASVGVTRAARTRAYEPVPD